MPDSRPVSRRTFLGLAAGLGITTGSASVGNKAAPTDATVSEIQLNTHDTTSQQTTTPSGSPPQPEWLITHTGDAETWASAAAPAHDTGCLIGGTTVSDGLAAKGWLAGVGSNGEFHWEEQYDGENRAWIIDIAQTRDGGYVIAGGTSPTNEMEPVHGWVAKLDATRTIAWSQTFTGEGDVVVGSVLELESGSVVVAGITGPGGDGFNRWDPMYGWAAKLDADGTTVWSRRYDGQGGAGIATVAPAGDDRVLLGGGTLPGNGQITANAVVNGWLAELDTTGEVIQSQTYQGKTSERVDTLVRSVAALETGEFVVCGSAFPNYWVGRSDGWVAKVDADLQVQWSYTDAGLGEVWGYESQPAANGIVAGGLTRPLSDTDSTPAQVWVTQTSPEGDQAWSHLYGERLHVSVGRRTLVPPMAATLTANQSIVLTGMTNPSDTWRSWVMKVSPV